MSLFSFPNQRIAESRKDIEWHKSHILGYLDYSLSKGYETSKGEIEELLAAYSAVITKKKERIIKATITERFGQNLGPKYEVYPLIENIIEQGIGLYRLRPLKRRAMVNNETAVIAKLEAKIDMISEQILREANQDVQSNLGFQPETENPDIEIPDDTEEFFEKDYRTISEEIAEDVIYQLLIVNKEKEKIYSMLRFFLITGFTVAFIDEKDGHPSIFIPDLRDCFFQTNPHETIQKNMQYFVFDKYFSYNDLLNTYDLTEKEIAQVEVYFGMKKNTESYSNGASNGINWFRNYHGDLNVRVVSMRWISRRKARFKSYVNENTGNEELKILSDDYKESSRDKKESSTRTFEHEDERFITMIGPDIVLEYGRVEKQLKKISAPKKRFIPAVALTHNNLIGTGEIRSLAKKLMYLQDFASEILYEMRLSVRQLDGNALVYDLANIPKEWMIGGMDNAIQKVNFYLKRDRTQYINSRDKRANPYASSVNVSQKGRLDDTLKLLAVIEDLAEKISGFVKENKGEAGEYQKASVAEMNRTAGTARTEEYFGLFDTFVETLLERLVLKSKFIYEENQVFTYFGGDHQMKFLKIFPDYLLEDIGFHIGDNRREFEKIEAIDQMAQASFMNPNSPELMLELLRMYNSDGASEKEAIFKKGIKQMQRMAEERMEAEQKMAQEANQQKADEKEADNEMKREGFQNNIDVANIYANNKADDTRERQANENLRKAADIEKDLIISERKNQKDS